MPSADSQSPSRSRSLLFLGTILVLGTVALVGYHVANQRKATQTQTVAATNTPAPVQTVSVAPAASPQPAAPGTLISAEEVLAKVDKWLAEHPNYHATAVSAFPNGTIMGKIDLFAYTNAVAGSVTALSAQIYIPQAIDFVGVKKDGKFKAYFPATDQLVEQDLSQAMASVPVLAGAPGFKALLKLAKNSYAEASADLEVATLVLNSKDLKLGDLPDTDIYLSIRSNNQGQLLGMDQLTGGGRIMTTMQYVTFDPATVIQGAPVLPAGKTVETNKTVQQVMRDEISLVSKKPLGKKI